METLFHFVSKADLREYAVHLARWFAKGFKLEAPILSQKATYAERQQVVLNNVWKVETSSSGFHEDWSGSRPVNERQALFYSCMLKAKVLKFLVVSVR